MKIQRSWIKMSVENLSDREVAPDTAYTRYTFEKSKSYVSFQPAWESYAINTSIEGNFLTIGFGTYNIEELTDTSLIIAQEGFRRIKLLSEDYLNSREDNLQQLGELNGKPFYLANKVVTPRYKKETPLSQVLSKNTEGYDFTKVSYFLMTFVVTEEGKIEHVKVENGLAEGFDAETVKNLLKTSKDWKPAYYKGKPVATQIHYDIKYLPSSVPHSLH